MRTPKGVPGGIPLSGSPSSESYTYGHALHSHFCMLITFVGLVSASRRAFLFLFPHVAPSFPRPTAALPSWPEDAQIHGRVPAHDRVHRASPKYEDGGVEPERWSG